MTKLEKKQLVSGTTVLYFACSTLRLFQAVKQRLEELGYGDNCTVPEERSFKDSDWSISVLLGSPTTYRSCETMTKDLSRWNHDLSKEDLYVGLQASLDQLFNTDDFRLKTETIEIGDDDREAVCYAGGFKVGCSWFDWDTIDQLRAVKRRLKK